ncbi:hypothetical protein T552_00327 [Pneumocystis carinii B80]|uniref:Uncharacterized protein n=1 Tax=Pneumocystis carinii (strain B80) TaxID=1408658 RepID=A0A0W4ZQF9_PNEC8|nr:hypothetical protein T552_00327 [Pneumocystis carinii B80]KTW30611.1 hypothetical protein T552_00327 [Pneumocystis carinii B80]
MFGRPLEDGGVNLRNGPLYYLKSNTAICIAGMSLIIFWVWKTSAEKEWRYHKPTRWIPSSLVNK